MNTDTMTLNTYASPTSFVGATKRLTAWADREVGVHSRIAMWIVLALTLSIVWSLLLLWYVIIFASLEVQR
jgi:hypothetical protein